MRTKLFALLMLVSLLASACAQATPAPVVEPEKIVETVMVEATRIVEIQ